MEIPFSGFATLGKEWKAEQVCSPFSRLYYITKGEGTLFLKGSAMPLLEGNVYLIPAGLVYSYNCPEYMEQLFFHINYTHMNGIDLFRSCDNVYSHPIAEEEAFQICGLYNSDIPADAILLQSCILEELSRFIDMADLKEPSLAQYSSLVKQVFTLAQTPVNINLRISDLAHTLHVAPSTLTKRFHQETGMTPQEYINQLVISKACSLLLNDEYSIARVAEILGFSDQFYFSKFFRKQMWTSPSRYRQQMKGGAV